MYFIDKFIYQKYLKLGKRHISKVCQTLYLCLSFPQERTKKNINTSISQISYPKRKAGQDTDMCDSSKRQPGTFSISNTLLRKCQSFYYCCSVTFGFSLCFHCFLQQQNVIKHDWRHGYASLSKLQTVVLHGSLYYCLQNTQSQGLFACFIKGVLKEDSYNPFSR